MKHKQTRPRKIISSICHKHHFSNPNTAEIVFSLLFIGIISRLLTFMSREGKY
jgi:hypothetical protein